MNKYQKELENLNIARLNINTVCKWLPKTVLDNLEDYGGEYDVYHYVNQGILKEIVDKETPMKVKPYPEFKKYFNVARCPKCERVVEIDDIYCRECGQRLDWSDTDAKD